MLHLLCTPYPVGDKLLDTLRRRDDVRIVTAPFPRKRAGSMRWAVAGKAFLGLNFFCRDYFDPSYYQAIRSIPADDRVLIFDPLSIVDFMCTVQELRTPHVYTWIWNSRRHFSKTPWRQRVIFSLFKKHSERLFTFDHADARTYGIPFKEQLYHRFEIPPRESGDTLPSSDLFFVGTERGRLPLFRGILREAERDGFRVDFHIVPSPPHDRYTEEDRAMLASGVMSYEEILQRIDRTRAIVELVQPGQHGCTLRAMEALFYGKKLITDNPAVTEEAFYRPENIYRLGRETRSIRTFLDEPAVPVPQEIIDRHDIVHWIESFLK